MTPITGFGKGLLRTAVGFAARGTKRPKAPDPPRQGVGYAVGSPCWCRAACVRRAGSRAHRARPCTDPAPPRHALPSWPLNQHGQNQTYLDWCGRRPAPPAATWRYPAGILAGTHVGPLGIPRGLPVSGTRRGNKELVQSVTLTAESFGLSRWGGGLPICPRCPYARRGGWGSLDARHW